MIIDFKNMTDAEQMRMKFKLMSDSELIKVYSDCSHDIIAEHEQELEECGEINAEPFNDIGMSSIGIQYMYMLFKQYYTRGVQVHGTYDDFENIMFTIKTKVGIRWLLTAWYYAMQMKD